MAAPIGGPFEPRIYFVVVSPFAVNVVRIILSRTTPIETRSSTSGAGHAGLLPLSIAYTIIRFSKYLLVAIAPAL